MLILGVDPGTAMIGVGLIEYTNKKAKNRGYACLKTSIGQTPAQRLFDLHSQLTSFIKKHQPDIMAVENIFFFKNQKTAVGVSQARGVILLTAAQASLPLYEFTPLQVKQALTGYGRAEKKQIQQMVKAVLSLKEIPQPDDAADALAIAICCAHSLKNNLIPSLAN